VCNLSVSLTVHNNIPPQTVIFLSPGKPGDEIVILLLKILWELVYMQNTDDDKAPPE